VDPLGLCADDAVKRLPAPEMEQKVYREGHLGHQLILALCRITEMLLDYLQVARAEQTTPVDLLLKELFKTPLPS